MSRLKRTPSGYIRSLQMSRYNLFAFVEGKRHDSYFYGSICDAACNPRGIKYRIIQSAELPVNTKGKQALIDYFKYLRRKSCLISTFKGKSTGCIFFADKDIDDILRSKLRSFHFVYTEFYEIENHIYNSGDLAEAAAAAASLPPNEVRDGIGNYNDWRKNSAEVWKEWIKLCIFTRCYSLNCVCNFGVKSRINKDLHGQVDPDLYENYLTLTRSNSGFSSIEFNSKFKKINRKVVKRYSSLKYDKVFKGNWYASFLNNTIKTIAAAKQYDADGLEKRLTSAVAQTLDFRETWSDYFRTPVERIIILL